ncbi:polysaccharide biosynthesis tyrosine autokinase [Derxia gummosa]|uniref:Polysaccharide biosynthesis tyrosine autokinase n=1 Tax=Derxia gummosa DSM 723 TaxID=1121388 RepID=A0A9U5GRV6_9BURK|nr:polysaccharide biosynthesis tyrosine autokinase [Derxia gummosa]
MNMHTRPASAEIHPQGVETIVARDAAVDQTLAADAELRDRPLGEILKEVAALSTDQINEILAHQRNRGIRFGEAAIELGYASADLVRFALARQFHYPYDSSADSGLAPELVCATAPFTAAAEAIRGVRSHLLSGPLSDPAQTQIPIAIVSPNSGEGRSYVAGNLAIAFAQLGRRTILVDADFRKPRQHEMFASPKSIGLAGVLSGRTQADVIHKVRGFPSLALLPVGVTPPNPLELIERPAFSLLLREFSSKFSYVLLDTPPGSYGSDARAIAARCGHAIVVTRKDRTGASQLRDFSASLRETGCKIVGVVLNEF